MPAINLSIEHGRTIPEAREALRSALEQTRGRFGPLVRTVAWSPDENAVTVNGVGFVVEMRVDATKVHVSGDVPMLGGLLGGPVGAGIKQIVTKVFQKRLAGGA